MTEPSFGLIFELVDDGPKTPTWGDFSVVGIVLPSDDANAVTFPLDTPVDINTGDSTVLADMGTGPMAQAILRINAQLDDLQRSARAVVVRVASGTDSDPETALNQTMGNIVGDAESGTGLFALLKAPQMLGVTPRLICCNGFTGTNRFAVQAPVHIDTPGSGYTGTPTVAFSPPGATGTVHVTSGAVTSITLNTPGNYPEGTTVTATISGGSGTGATASVTLERLNNPVCAVLPQICEALLAHAVVGGPGDTKTKAIAWEGLLNSKRLIPVDNWEIVESTPVRAHGTVTFTTNPTAGVLSLGGTDVTIVTANPVGNQVISGVDLTSTIGNLINFLQGSFDDNILQCSYGGTTTTLTIKHKKTGPEGNAFTLATTISGATVSGATLTGGADASSTQYVDGAASTIGIGVRVDFSHGGFPFWSFANQPVQGLLGLKRIDSFSLVDGATDAQELLADDIGVTVKGDRSDVSLTDSGFQHISFRNAGADTEWNLYNKTRGRDFIHLALMKSLRQRLGVENITLHSVQAVLNDMAAIAADLKNQECVIGWHVGFRASDNSAVDLRDGKFTVYFNAEQPAPILVITIKSGLDFKALDAELAALATELSDITQQPGQAISNF